ncbi:hypothetical protein P9112_008946 [Eukaryota sp. TZLM1-RC]
MFPRLCIYPSRLYHNATLLNSIASQQGMSIVAITKCVCADIQIASQFVQAGIKTLGDSRLENLQRLRKHFGPAVELMLVRLPSISQAKEVVHTADISLITEISTAKALNNAAKKLNTIHKLVLMVDVGDRREGLFGELHVFNFITQIKSLRHLKLIGIGANLTCLSGVLPSTKNLSLLSNLSAQIEKQLGYKISVVSTGGSSSVPLLMDKCLPKGINQLRVGCSLLLGRTTGQGDPIKGFQKDSFILEAEIIELQDKPSFPEGDIGRDAFGRVPEFNDIGIRKRAILAVGMQDITTRVICMDKDVYIIGASSDHLVVDVTDSTKHYSVGGVMQFQLHYAALVSAFTSQYVQKDYFKV